MTSEASPSVPVAELQDVIELVIDHRGKTPKKLGGDFTSNGVPVISAIHIKDGRINWSERERYVSEEMHRKWMPVRLRENDILLTSEAPLGEVAFVPSDDDLVLSQRLFALRTKPDLMDSAFLKYFLSSAQGQSELWNRATGSTVLGIRQAELMRVRVPVPELGAQQRAGNLLRSIDQLIDVNVSTSSILESIAQTLFRSWFVDFDPVRAKMAGEKPVGMDDATAALFPDSVEESELGEIPAGWTVRGLPELAEIQYGAPFASKLFNSSGEGTPLLRIRDLKAQAPSTWTTETHPKGFIAEAGDLLIGMDGEFNPTLWLGENSYVNQRVCRVLPGNNVAKFFLYFSLIPVMRRIERGSTGSTVIHLGKSDLDTIKLLSPPVELLDAYRQVVSPMLSQMVSLKSQNRALETMRDALLPRLISGELQVPEDLVA